VISRIGYGGALNAAVMFGSIWLLGSWFNEAWSKANLEIDLDSFENSLDQLEDLEDLITARKAELQALNKKD
jgi:hypothetical protein